MDWLDQRSVLEGGCKEQRVLGNSCEGQWEIPLSREGFSKLHNPARVRYVLKFILPIASLDADYTHGRQLISPELQYNLAVHKKSYKSTNKKMQDFMSNYLTNRKETGCVSYTNNADKEQVQYLLLLLVHVIVSSLCLIVPVCRIFQGNEMLW